MGRLMFIMNIDFVPKWFLFCNKHQTTKLFIINIKLTCIFFISRFTSYNKTKNHWQSLSMSTRLTYLSVYDSRDDTSEPGPSTSPSSSLTHVHRCSGYHNPNWQSLPKSSRLTYLTDVEVYSYRTTTTESSWDDKVCVEPTRLMTCHVTKER